MYSRIALISILSIAHLSTAAADEEEIPWEDRLTARADAPSSAAAPHQVASDFASSRPNLSAGAGIILSGDFLYWKAEEEGLVYGFRSINPGQVGLMALGNPFKGIFGRPSRIHPEWEPGYRLGISYNIPHDQWDLALLWTRYDASRRDSIGQRPGEVVFPYWTNTNFLPLATSAKAKWELEFNTLELDLGRAFKLGSDFSIRPFAGFKAAWIEQELHVDYQNITFVLQEKSPNIFSKNHNNFQGYGIQGGLEGRWCLGAGFHVFGKFEGGLLWGNFDIAQFESEPHDPRTKITEGIHEVIPQLGMQGGLGWSYLFPSHRLFLNIRIAWEEQVWFHQNQLNREIGTFNEGLSISSRGDLTLSGLTIGAKLGF